MNDWYLVLEIVQLDRENVVEKVEFVTPRPENPFERS